jgi:hypothetical protein
MAKTQNLSLNPTKISGTCGRLMCCLKYEQNAYEDAAKRMPKVESFVQTPDGPGNVKSIDLLRETVKVSLDNGSEGLKQYRNCEIRILRNGKGSRDGIEIGERTERYVEEKEEVLVPPVIATPFFVDEALEEAPVREKMSEVSEGGRARHRGPRHSRKGGKAVAEERSGVIAEKKPEKKQKSEKPAQKADKAAKPARNEKNAEKGEKNVEKNAENRGEKRTDNKRRDRRFGEKKGEKKESGAAKPQEKTEKGGEKAPKGGEPKGDKKPQRPRPPRKPKAEGAGERPEKKPAAEGEKKPHRPHYRGGRGRGGKPGGQGGAPKAE